jgi:hypothetical protein
MPPIFGEAGGLLKLCAQDGAEFLALVSPW